MKQTTYIINSDEILVGAGTAAPFAASLLAIFPNKTYLLKRVIWTYRCRSVLNEVIPRQLNESMAFELSFWNSDNVPAVNEYGLGLSPIPRLNFPAAPDRILRLFESGIYNFGYISFRNYLTFMIHAENYSGSDVYFESSLIIDVEEDE
jgi:hypothetical protein